MSGQEEKEGLRAREMSRTPVDIKPSPKGRLLKEMAVYELLDELKISYQRVDHEAAATAMVWMRLWAFTSAKIFFYVTGRRQISIF